MVEYSTHSVPSHPAETLDVTIMQRTAPLKLLTAEELQEGLQNAQIRLAVYTEDNGVDEFDPGYVQRVQQRDSYHIEQALRSGSVETARYIAQTPEYSY